MVVIGCTLALASAQYTWPDAAPVNGQSFRVFGTSPAAVAVNDGWKSRELKLESPLPVGYAAPTPDDTIEIKSYASVRRAEFKKDDLFFSSMWPVSRAFKKLFDHIKSRKIAMTSPVEMNYRKMTDRFGLLDSDKGDWTMSFLYRTPDLGRVGSFEDDVRVVDTKEITVISIGFKGDYTYQAYNDNLKYLYKALKTQEKWVLAGEPRVFNYNSPMVDMKWGEVQLPIKLAL